MYVGAFDFALKGYIMRSLRWMPILGFTFLFLAGGCTVAPPTTSASPIPTPAVSEEKAIAIAATQLPLQVVERATVQIDDVVGWRVKFLEVNTTKQELNWPEDGRNQFGPGVPGSVPDGVFTNVGIIVNPSTGNIDTRIATNGVFLAIPPRVR